MRPLRLEFQGLHSYRDPVDIDFERLTQSGFFGIFGPTGAGKSTILDAITLALFGKVDRTSSLADSVTSGADSVWVRFRFRLGDGKYEVYRRLERRGSGLASADFYLARDGERLPLEGVVLLNRAVEELLGLTFEQFITAVFLPQGKFARFLRLKPAERRTLLAEIFRLERFGEPLYRAVRDRVRDLAAEEEALIRELSALQDVSEEALVATEEELRKLEERQRFLERELEALERRRRDAEEFLKITAQMEELSRRFAEFVGKPWSPTSREEIEERLKLSDLARNLVDALKERERVFRELEAAREELSAAEKELEELRHKKAYLEDEAKRKLEALNARERTLREIKGKLSGLDPQKVASLEGKVRSLSEELASLPAGEPSPFSSEEIARVEGILREALGVVPRIEELGRRIRELEEAIAADRTKVMALDREIGEAEREHVELERLFSAREAELSRLRRELAAAELARGLIEGEPCPVCGSRHHPEPAAFPEAVDLEGLEAELEGLRRKLQEVRGNLSAKRAERTLSEKLLGERERKLGELRAEKASLEEELGGLRSRLPERLRFVGWEELGERIAVWRAALERERLVRQREEAVAELKRLDEAWREIVEGLGEIYSPIAPDVLVQWKEKLESQLRRIAEDRRRIEGNLEEFGKRERELSTAAAEARGRVAELSQALEKAAKRIELLSGETGIPPAEAESLALSTAERECLEEAVGLARRLELLAESASGLGISDAREAEATRTAYADKRRELDELRHRIGEVKERIRALEEKLSRKGELEERRGELRKELALQQELEGLLRGKAFLEYLVGNQFERILSRASHYTAQLSQGRFVLQGEGTELLVVDYRNGGVARHTHTLSGGETFLVSLSLALALSEAIQLGRRSGAPPIEFFFIDEGFGSLDEESVRMVLELLCRLVDEGLKVGVITHVEALRRGIPYKLLVYPPDEERGSRVELVIGE